MVLSGRLLASATATLFLLSPAARAAILVAAAVLKHPQYSVVLRLCLPFPLILVVVLPVDPPATFEVGLSDSSYVGLPGRVCGQAMGQAAGKSDMYMGGSNEQKKEDL